MLEREYTKNEMQAKVNTEVGCDSNMLSRTGKIAVMTEVWADSSFSIALAAAKEGSRITRKGWNASGQWVTVQYPDKMTEPYLYIKNSNNGLIPWVPSQGDLFAQDWAVLPSN